MKATRWESSGDITLEGEATEVAMALGALANVKPHWGTTATAVPMIDKPKSDEMSEAIQASRRGRKARRRYNGGRRATPWSDGELDILNANAHRGIDELARILPNRTVMAIGAKLRKIKSEAGGATRPMERWTQAEEDILRLNSTVHPSRLVELLPGRTEKAIRQRLRSVTGAGAGDVREDAPLRVPDGYDPITKPRDWVGYSPRDGVEFQQA